MKWHFLDDGVLINNARTSAINESDATPRWMVIITSHILASSGSEPKQRMDSELLRWLDSFWWGSSARTFDINRSASHPPTIQKSTTHNCIPSPQIPIDCQGKWKFVQMFATFVLIFKVCFLSEWVVNIWHVSNTFSSLDLRLPRQWTLIGKIMDNTMQEILEDCWFGI